MVLKNSINNIRERDYSFDFIKIIATIFIIFYHYQQVLGIYFENGINFFNGKFYFGYVVELFFVLSGLFMYSYIEKIQKGVTFPKFYLKRLGRLFPLLTVGAISYEILQVIYQHVYQSSWFGTTTTFWGTIISAFGIQDGWALPNPCVNNPTWYISVLMLCYVIFYFLVYIAKRLDLKVQYLFVFMIFLGMGINTYGINLPFLNASSCRGYYAFFFGLLLAEFLEKHDVGKVDAIISAIMIMVITLLIIFKYDFMALGINYIMTFIYYPALILLCRSKSVSKILNRKIIGKLGRISFDSFIWHVPLFLVMYICIKVFNWNLKLDSYVIMICYAAFCYIVGTISYYIIERPTAKLVDKKLKEI